MTDRVRLLWPIVDETAPAIALLEQARREIPALARQAHARIVGPGRFTWARSCDVPGSGRVTEWVLVFEAPAQPLPVRVPPTLEAAS